MDTRAGRAINRGENEPSRARVISLVLRGGVREAPPAGAVGGWVLDISALVAFVEGNEYAASVRAMAERTGRTLLVPLPALAAAARRRSAPNAEARLAALLAEPMVVAVDGAV